MKTVTGLGTPDSMSSSSDYEAMTLRVTDEYNLSAIELKVRLQTFEKEKILSVVKYETK